MTIEYLNGNKKYDDKNIHIRYPFNDDTFIRPIKINDVQQLNESELIPISIEELLKYNHHPDSDYMFSICNNLASRDSVIFHPDGRIKFVKGSKTLTHDNKAQLTENHYENQTGFELSFEQFTKLQDSEELKNQVLAYLIDDFEVYDKYNERCQSILIKDYKNISDFVVEKPLYIEARHKGSSIFPIANGRFSISDSSYGGFETLGMPIEVDKIDSSRFRDELMISPSIKYRINRDLVLEDKLEEIYNKNQSLYDKVQKFSSPKGYHNIFPTDIDYVETNDFNIVVCKMKEMRQFNSKYSGIEIRGWLDILYSSKKNPDLVQNEPTEKLKIRDCKDPAQDIPGLLSCDLVNVEPTFFKNVIDIDWAKNHKGERRSGYKTQRIKVCE